MEISHDFLETKIKESEKGNVCAWKGRNEKCVDRKLFSICKEMPFGSVPTSLIGMKENVQEVT